MNTGPELIRPVENRERNWLPMAIAAVAVLLVAALVIVALEHGKSSSTVAASNAQLDPYAASLPISGVNMSESGNLAGGKVTYIDGQIANNGSRTVSGIVVQVLFRNIAHEVVQNDPPQPLKLIRTRDPYVDTEPISAAPLKPGDQREFRLSFDAVSPDWDGAYPEIRILKVQNQ
jgi:hypothetical protein